MEVGQAGAERFHSSCGRVLVESGRHPCQFPSATGRVEDILVGEEDPDLTLRRRFLRHRGQAGKREGSDRGLAVAHLVGWCRRKREANVGDHPGDTAQQKQKLRGAADCSYSHNWTSRSPAIWWVIHCTRFLLPRKAADAGRISSRLNQSRGLEQADRFALDLDPRRRRELLMEASVVDAAGVESSSALETAPLPQSHPPAHCTISST